MQYILYAVTVIWLVMRLRKYWPTPIYKTVIHIAFDTYLICNMYFFGENKVDSIELQILNQFSVAITAGFLIHCHINHSINNILVAFSILSILCDIELVWRI